MTLDRRARDALMRPGAWLEQAGDDWLVRSGPDRRRRPVMQLGSAEIRSLQREPGLLPRTRGGWLLSGADPEAAPGRMATQSLRLDPKGRSVQVTANRGESPILWLARRRGPDGLPWLSPVEVMAAERLRDDFERAGLTGRLTMDWGAVPRDRTARGPGPAPMASGARRRVRQALAEVGPGLREMLEHVCLCGSALQAAERSLGIPSRTGKVRLKLALDRLARHYRLI